MANENLHELDELRNEEDESEDEESQEGVTDNFAGDIAIEKTHGEKGECNMEGDSDGDTEGTEGKTKRKK